MYGEEFRPDQMSINRTLEAVWMMPLLNPNRNEINCRSCCHLPRLEIKKNHLHENQRGRMREQGGAEASNSEAKSKSEISRASRNSIQQESSRHRAQEATEGSQGKGGGNFRRLH